MAKGKKKKRKQKKAGLSAEAVVPPLVSEAAGAGGRLLMTIPEVCDYLAISRATLYRLDLPGRLKIGGQVRFHRPTIEHWVLEQLG